MSGGVSATTVIAGIGAAAAVGSAGYAVHQGQMAKKEQDRQKAIGAEQMKKQDEAVAAQKKMADDEEAALQKEIQDKQRSDMEANNAVVAADQVNKRRQRGQRSLIYSGDDEEELLGL